MPSSSSHSTPIGETKCVDIGWSLGILDASSRSTRCPARARWVAREAPAQRAPTTIVSWASADMRFFFGAQVRSKLLAQEGDDERGRALGLVHERPVSAALQQMDLDRVKELSLLLRVPCGQEGIARPPKDERGQVQGRKPVGQRAAHSVEIRRRTIQLEDSSLGARVHVVVHAVDERSGKWLGVVRIEAHPERRARGDDLKELTDDGRAPNASVLVPA